MILTREQFNALSADELIQCCQRHNAEKEVELRKAHPGVDVRKEYPEQFYKYNRDTDTLYRDNYHVDENFHKKWEQRKTEIMPWDFNAAPTSPVLLMTYDEEMSLAQRGLIRGVTVKDGRLCY